MESARDVRKCCIWKCKNDATVVRMEKLQTECPGGEIFWLGYCKFHKDVHLFDGLELDIRST